MSTTDFAKMPTEDLIREFASTARRTPTLLWDHSPEAWTRTPEREEAIRNLRAMGAELRARKPIARLRQLFEDESRNVRGWAGGQFLSADPEWAAASLDGARENRTTREILAWRQHTLEGPPDEPPIAEMSVDQLVERFQDACTRLYATTRFLTDEEGGGDTMAAYNHISDEIYDLAKELEERGRLDALIPLLDDPLITVRQKAASYCLPAAPERAIAALEAIIALGPNGPSPEYLKACDALEYWRRENPSPA